jgi:hypothetical protein
MNVFESQWTSMMENEVQPGGVKGIDGLQIEFSVAIYLYHP